VRNVAFADLAEVRAVAPQYRHMMSAKGKWPDEADIDIRPPQESTRKGNYEPHKVLGAKDSAQWPVAGAIPPTP
jgi:hypothetical protein